MATDKERVVIEGLDAVSWTELALGTWARKGTFVYWGSGPTRWAGAVSGYYGDVNEQIVDYTLTLADAGRIVEINAGTGNNVTLPAWVKPVHREDRAREPRRPHVKEPPILAGYDRVRILLLIRKPDVDRLRLQTSIFLAQVAFRVADHVTDARAPERAEPHQHTAAIQPPHHPHHDESRGQQHEYAQ